MSYEVTPTWLTSSPGRVRLIRRRQGRASACLGRAREIASEAGCYKIMLLTGAKSEDTLQFYRKCGYRDGDKTAFVQWLPEQI